MIYTSWLTRDEPLSELANSTVMREPNQREPKYPEMWGDGDDYPDTQNYYGAEFPNEGLKEAFMFKNLMKTSLKISVAK